MLPLVRALERHPGRTRFPRFAPLLPPASRAAAFAVGSVVAVVMLAVALRLIGLQYGLPAVYNPDEVAIMSRALALATGDLNPHNFLYPSFYFYALCGWIGLTFAGGFVAGAFESVGAFETLFFVNPTVVYTAGRALSVACAAATVMALFVLARRLFGTGVALAAASLLAVMPLHVRDSHYVKHDVPVTLAIVVAQLAILRLADAPVPRRRAAAALAGVACGVAFSTHYYTVFLALPLAIAVRSIGELSVAAVTAAAGFFALSPFILLEPATAWNDITANRAIVVDRAVGAGRLFASASSYLRMLWTEVAGWPTAALAVAGLVRLARRGPRVTMLLLAFPVAFLAFIANTVAASRYLVPVTPTLALLAALGAFALAEAMTRLRFLIPGGISHCARGPAVLRCRGAPPPRGLRAVARSRLELSSLAAGPHRRGSRLSRSARAAGAPLLAAALVMAAAIPALTESVRVDRFFRQADTRTLAQRFVESTVPAGSTIALQPHSVPLVQSRESLVESLRATIGDPTRASTKFQRRLALNPYPAPAYRLIWIGDGGLDADKIYLSYRAFGSVNGLGALRRLGVEYVIVKRYNKPESATIPFLDALAREGKHLATFSPDGQGSAAVEPFLHNTDATVDRALDRPGPTIEIWNVAPYR